MSNTSLFTCQGTIPVIQSYKGVLLVRAVLPAPLPLCKTVYVFPGFIFGRKLNVIARNIPVAIF